MKKYEGKSIRNVKTNTGKIPSGVGFSGNVRGVTNPKGIICNAEAAEIQAKLGYLREELKQERISTEELIELQNLVEHIDPNDTDLLEAAGVPENSTNRAIVNGEL